MAQQGLHVFGLGAVLEQMSGKGMSQGVRRNILQISDRRVVTDNGPEKLACQRLFLM